MTGAIGRRPSVVLAVLAASSVCGSLMQTMLIPLQPRLPALLDAAPEDTAWLVTITLLCAAVSTPIAGRLGDIYGKRRVILVLLALLICGSVLIATTSTLAVALIGRALQGCTVGLVPLAMAVARDVLPADKVPGAVAAISATLGIGGAAGLPLSALVAQSGDWHLLFWGAAAVGALAALSIFLVVAPSPRNSHGRFDPWGALGIGVGLVGLLLALTRGQYWGWSSPATIGSAAAGLAVLVLWGWHQSRARHPLVNVRLAARAAVLPAHLAALSMGFALFASNVAFPQILQLPTETGYGSGLGMLPAALVLTPQALGMIAVSSIAGKLNARVGARVMLIIGASGIAAGYGIALVSDMGPIALLIANTVIGLGIGFGYSALPNIVMAATPDTETAAANALNALMRSIGTTIAAAAVGAILVGSMTSQHGVAVPSHAAFTVAIGLGAAAAVITGGLAVAPPRHRRDRA